MEKSVFFLIYNYNNVNVALKIVFYKLFSVFYLRTLVTLKK